MCLNRDRHFEDCRVLDASAVAAASTTEAAMSFVQGGPLQHAGQVGMTNATT